jgi:hypothetical protein
MVARAWHARVGQTICAQNYPQERWCRWCMVLVVCVLSQWWCVSSVRAADRERPVRIGALTASWGPTPMIVGLRDGLLELGYREDEDFVLGVRFTQGDIAALPEATRQLVAYTASISSLSMRMSRPRQRNRPLRRSPLYLPRWQIRKAWARSRALPDPGET